jgi:hypothetical protein
MGGVLLSLGFIISNGFARKRCGDQPTSSLNRHRSADPQKKAVVFLGDENDLPRLSAPRAAIFGAMR